jgi:hypothetical protein
MQTRGSGASLSTLTASDTETNWGIREYKFEKASSQSVISPTASNTSSINYTGETFNSTIWTIGGFNSGSYIPSFSGNIAFLAVYSATPTGAQLSDLRTYLQDRYAL